MKFMLVIMVFYTAILFGAQENEGSSSVDVTNPNTSHIGSKSPMVDFINSVDWDFFFDEFSISLSPCWCDQTSSDLPVGLKATLVEPLLGFSTSNQPMHLVGLGTQLESDVFAKRGTSRRGEDNSTERTSFRQANIITFPILALVGAALPDIICFERNSEITSSWISDVDPIYNSEFLSNSQSGNSISTRTGLSGLVADLACVPECVSATAGYPMNALYWCAGCRGSLGTHDTGFVRMGDPVENSEIIALRQLGLQHLTFRLLKTSDASFTMLPSGTGGLPDTMCESKIFPMLIKSQYFIQLAYGSAKTFGAMRFHYDFKSTPTDQDAFFYWIWRKRDFCMGQTKCG
ncbi:TraU family protein [Helicobacter equorum]|uniref:Uncharacterized protein n=1 Tax=Helicobacter equorum TaxID=361872 RepID=A0A3D8IMJ7_9HELI|nr:TraU family protein [Helicobacter equorum]RDU66422.1 hypothetical protein CQA54_06910 [Helicobacter equorum]